MQLIEIKNLFSTLVQIAPPGGGSLELNAASDFEDFLGISNISTLMQMALLGAFILLGLWTTLSRAGIGQLVRPGGPRLRDLFLAVRFRSGKTNGDAGTEQTGYIRALDLHSALLVSSRPLRRGANVTLSLGSLPGFPQDSTDIPGHVLSSRAVGGEPETHLVKVAFDHVDRRSREPLLHYLQSMARANAGTLSHA
jgi:hypothetical protein